MLNTPGFLRYFDATIERLLERGHDVMLAFTRPDLRPESLDIYRERTHIPTLLGKAPDRDDVFRRLANGIRQSVDYARYLDPRFAEAEYLRNRRRSGAFQFAPWMRVFGMRRTLPQPLPALLVKFFLLCERALPTSTTIDRYLAQYEPDVLLVSPLVTGASQQTDYVKSAKRLGIPCGVLIASWDNLTNKGLLREVPDKVIVWNDAQRREAREFHGVPDARVVVTGAQPFDRWFGRKPSQAHDVFCAKVGLSPDVPYVMFVGSTSNIARAGVEEAFVRRWIETLRASSDPVVATAGLLIRPHPDRPGSWDSLDLGGFENVVVWPPRRPNSVTSEARSEYFDSLYHSAAVVGINTSAMVEAAIIRRPVLTVRSPDVKEAQDGTLHFAYLLPENGGFLRVAADLDGHVTQLGACLRDPETTHSDRDRFITAFIRPHGNEVPANAVLVEAVERLACVPAAPARHPALLYPLRGFLYLVALLGHRWLDRRDPGAVRARLQRRTRALAAAAARAEERSPRLARALARAAARHEQWSRRRLTIATRRHEEVRRRRKERRRLDKERGQELLRGTRGAGGNA